MKNSYAAADDLPSIFQGVGILPTQYNDLHRRKFTLEGERRLLFAVLEDAIRCSFAMQTKRLSIGGRRTVKLPHG